MVTFRARFQLLVLDLVLEISFSIVLVLELVLEITFPIQLVLDLVLETYHVTLSC